MLVRRTTRRCLRCLVWGPRRTRPSHPPRPPAACRTGRCAPVLGCPVYHHPAALSRRLCVGANTQVNPHVPCSCCGRLCSACNRPERFRSYAVISRWYLVASADSTLAVLAVLTIARTATDQQTHSRALPAQSRQLPSAAASLPVRPPFTLYKYPCRTPSRRFTRRRGARWRCRTCLNWPRRPRRCRRPCAPRLGARGR